MNERGITEITRRAIIDQLILDGVNWSGRLPEDDFLSRLYNLDDLPSTDHRLKGAGADIRQHRVNWNDWPPDWIFFDERFGLLHGDDELFVRFLTEVVHPVVRPDTDSSRALVTTFNEHLRTDGWMLVESATISGHPVFTPSRTGIRSAAFEEPTGWEKVDRQLAETRDRLGSANEVERYQAVGLLCREVLISLAQEVFHPLRHPTADGIVASNTDAARMLDAFIAKELLGRSNEESRAYAKASLKLTVALQHRRSADFRTAALCLEATASLANLIAILSGRRG
jgi:hypothetical protein